MKTWYKNNLIFCIIELSLSSLTVGDGWVNMKIPTVKAYLILKLFLGTTIFLNVIEPFTNTKAL